MKHLTAKFWWILMLRGMLGLLLGLDSFWLLGNGQRNGDAFGFSHMIRPIELMVTLIFLLGLYAFLEGVFSIVLGLQDFGQGRRWWVLIGEGFLTLGLGLLAWMKPGYSVLILLYWMAAWAILMGFTEIGQGLRGTGYRDRRPIFFYAGLLSLLFGSAILWQGMGSGRLAWIIGLYAVASSFPLILLGRRLRRFHTGYMKSQKYAIGSIRRLG